jgi:hypothetical protein
MGWWNASGSGVKVSQGSEAGQRRKRGDRREKGRKSRQTLVYTLMYAGIEPGLDAQEPGLGLVGRRERWDLQHGLDCVLYERSRAAAAGRGRGPSSPGGWERPRQRIPMAREIEMGHGTTQRTMTARQITEISANMGEEAGGDETRDISWAAPRSPLERGTRTRTCVA